MDTSDPGATISDFLPESTADEPQAGFADALAMTEQAALLPQPASIGDMFLALLALFAALGGGLLLAGGPGRAVEYVVAMAFVGAAYFMSWRAGRLLAPAGLIVYLVLEWHYGRLDRAHYWQDALFAGVIGLSALAASYLRLTNEQRRIGLIDARAMLEEREGVGGGGVGIRGLPPLDYELERARRHNHQVSLLVIRADDADEVELRYGDGGLRLVNERIVHILARSLRATDVPLRNGRLDHWVILPQATSLEARAAAERVRLAVGVERVEFSPGELMDMSISIGVASFPDDGTTNDEVVQAARHAFAGALELGGNHSVLHSGAAEMPPGWALTAGPAH